MTDFMIRFLISNVFIAAVTAVLALVRGLFSRVLSARMRYLLWFVLLGLLAVPFLPFRLVGLPQLLSGLRGPDASLFPAAASGAEASAAIPAVWNMACRHPFDASFVRAVRTSSARSQKIGASPSKSKHPQAVPSLPERTGNPCKHPGLQHGIFKIPRYCRAFQTLYLSAASPDFRL